MNYLLIHGDVQEALRQLAAESFDSAVTDPPYNIGFLGKRWDSIGSARQYQTWCERWAAESFRVLKPGAHILAFGSTRTYHRLAAGIEDAGFEMRGAAYNALGRWPANVLLDCEAAEALDAQSGVRAGGAIPANRRGIGYAAGAKGTVGPRMALPSGAASRFFYCAKASKRERGEGNNHPTVKPLALMRWLVRLVTPAGGSVLDTFVGSGSTGVAALEQGFSFTGIDKDAHHVEIARRRIDQAVAGNEASKRQNTLFREVAS